MTKTERMMNLINLIKSREVLTVQDMSREFGISQRTVYRDLKTLAKMNVPIYYEDGYRIGRETHLPDSMFDSREKELVRFCLRHNPLSIDPLMGAKFREIEKKIFGLQKKGEVNKESIFYWDTGEAVSQPLIRTDIIINFVRAIISGKKVNINMKKQSSVPSVLIPVAVKMTREGTLLVVSDDSKNPLRDILISEIETLAVLADKVNTKPSEVQILR
ncbi:MAG: HTH domain-containing protein [candidate division Zixibacteria bacterium]|nr:HTH domain-containing protein [candidate division Zixibacteria bacterium]MDD5425388.1 HTH domain-containing protein [candidate division Zixibacteria bacterium]